MRLLKKIKPHFWDHGDDQDPGALNFRRMWQINFLVACLVTLTPLFLVVWYCFSRGGMAFNGVAWLVGASVPAVLVAILVGTLRQVNRLYRLDVHRSEILREIVYTHKMASVGRLATGVAHEINNPLAVIREKAGLMKDLIKRDREQCDWNRMLALLGSVEENCQRASAITHRLLGLGSHVRLALEELDPVQVIHDVMNLFRQKSHYRGIAVEINAAAGLPPLRCDRRALEQVVLNILDNAFEVLPDGGSINIAVSSQDAGHLRLVFKDDGPGIAKEDLKQLFEPFFSARPGRATGLGLSITYGIVHKLGGEIKVESEKGRGASFILILPLEPPAGRDQAAEESISRWALHAKGPGD